MLKVGDAVGSFDAQTSTGQNVSLEALRGTPFIVYFYPKSFTSGCTIETRRFASLYEDFKELGVEVLGVSSDSVQVQCDFADKMSASFPLVSDPAGKIYKAFGLSSLKMYRLVRRVTFFVDEQGKVEFATSVGINFHGHPMEMLEYAQARSEGA